MHAPGDEERMHSSACTPAPVPVVPLTVVPLAFVPWGIPVASRMPGFLCCGVVTVVAPGRRRYDPLNMFYTPVNVSGFATAA
eukprot:362342-Chlamydomonas_euryale.AAC.1